MTRRAICSRPRHGCGDNAAHHALRQAGLIIGGAGGGGAGGGGGGAGGGRAPPPDRLRGLEQVRPEADTQKWTGC